VAFTEKSGTVNLLLELPDHAQFGSPVRATRVICPTRLTVSRWYRRMRAIVSRLVNTRSFAPRCSSTCRQSCHPWAG
jgi:hypothetical protein